MKQLFIALILSLCGIAVQAAKPVTDSQKTHLMSLPPFERACVLIRQYETLHSPKHWPTIAYGHVVKEDERYTKRQYSHAEANAILKKDLGKLCASYRDFGADSLLLACLAYNVGVSKVNKSRLVKKLKSGRRDIYKDYTSFCIYHGRRLEALFKRRWLELELLFKP